MSIIEILLTSLVSLVIFYYTIKYAVKNAILEVNKIKTINKISGDRISQSFPELNPNEIQITLQKKYEAGLMSFDEFKKEWNGAHNRNP